MGSINLPVNPNPAVLLFQSVDNYKRSVYTPVVGNETQPSGYGESEMQSETAKIAEKERASLRNQEAYLYEAARIAMMDIRCAHGVGIPVSEKMLRNFANKSVGLVMNNHADALIRNDAGYLFGQLARKYLWGRLPNSLTTQWKPENNPQPDPRLTPLRRGFSFPEKYDTWHTFSPFPALPTGIIFCGMIPVWH